MNKGLQLSSEGVFDMQHEWMKEWMDERMGGFGLMALRLLKQHQYVLFDVVCAADDDSDQSERHLQRGPAHGGGRALAGLSSAGVLQPGTYTDHRQI